MSFVMFVQIHQAHYKIIAILQCISITSMLRVLMCIYSRSQNEASKCAGKRTRSTLHQSRAFRPSCPTGFPGVVFRLFYKHLGLPGLCRAPPARGCFRGLLRGSQRSFLRSFLGSFWTQLELSSHVFDCMTRE